jgi:hypothetical protein
MYVQDSTARVQSETQTGVWNSERGGETETETRTRASACVAPSLLRYLVEYRWRRWILGASSEAVLAHLLHLTVGAERREFLDNVAQVAWSHGYCKRRRLSLRLRRVE